jgi:hypothetical protein
VLHYDDDYDLIAEKTDLDSRASGWPPEEHFDGPAALTSAGPVARATGPLAGNRQLAAVNFPTRVTTRSPSSVSTGPPLCLQTISTVPPSAAVNPPP